MLRPRPAPGALWGGQRCRSPRGAPGRGRRGAPSDHPRACSGLIPSGGERLVLPMAAAGPQGHRQRQRGLQGDQSPIPDGTAWTEASWHSPILGAAAFPELFLRLGLADSLAPGKVLSGARNPISRWLPKLGWNQGFGGQGRVGMRRGCLAAGVDPRKGWQASAPSRRAGLLASKGFRRHRGCLGFSRQEDGGRARRGDFNFVASNENDLCQEIARAASDGERGRPGPADTGIRLHPLTSPGGWAPV